jgi:hypothetical protein
VALSPWPIRSGAITVCRSASRSATARQCFDEFTMPWISTTGGPLPATR